MLLHVLKLNSVVSAVCFINKLNVCSAKLPFKFSYGTRTRLLESNVHFNPKTEVIRFQMSSSLNAGLRLHILKCQVFLA